MQKSKKQAQARSRRLQIIEKFQNEVFMPLTYMHAKYRRNVVDVAVEKKVLVPAVKSPKAVLFHRSVVARWEEALASGKTVLDLTAEACG
jgi:hypothetical protein